MRFCLLYLICRHAGTVVKVHHSQGDLVKVGAPLVDIQLTAEAAAAAAGATDAAAAGTASSSSSSSGSDTDGPRDSSLVRAAPTVRRLARELGVDLSKVTGSGPDGRILKEDVEKFKSGLVSHIADKLVDRIAQTAGPTSTAEMYAAAAEPRFEADSAGQVPGAVGGVGVMDRGVQAAESGGARVAAEVAEQAAGGAKGPQDVTRIPIRGYRRWVCNVWVFQHRISPCVRPVSRHRLTLSSTPPGVVSGV